MQELALRRLSNSSTRPASRRTSLSPPPPSSPFSSQVLQYRLEETRAAALHLILSRVQALHELELLDPHNASAIESDLNTNPSSFIRFISPFLNQGRPLLFRSRSIVHFFAAFALRPAWSEVARAYAEARGCYQGLISLLGQHTSFFGEKYT